MGRIYDRYGNELVAVPLDESKNYRSQVVYDLPAEWGELRDGSIIPQHPPRWDRGTEYVQLQLKNGMPLNGRKEEE